MKNIIFSIAFLVAMIACSKPAEDCDNVRSVCTYVQFGFSDCTPNGSEHGWQWDTIVSDTVVSQVWGCPEKLNADFTAAQTRVIDNPATPESLRKFMEIFPSTCNCE